MRTRKLEAAIAAIIESGDKAMLDLACHIAEQLPKERQRRALKAIVRAI
jgi:hypothetical protein